MASDAGLALGPVVTPRDLLRHGAGPYPGYDDRATAALLGMARYVADVLTADNPELGRPGAVCPFAAAALQHGRIRLVASSLDRADAEAVCAVMAHMRQLFLATATLSPQRDGADHAVIAVFPALPPHAGATLIERVQRALKPDFVESGLMIGEFHPTCAAPGLHNPAFRPFRAPAIALAVRALTVQDAPFMAGHARCTAAFHRRFGPGDRGRLASHG